MVSPASLKEIEEREKGKMKEKEEGSDAEPAQKEGLSVYLPLHFHHTFSTLPFLPIYLFLHSDLPFSGRLNQKQQQKNKAVFVRTC